jgi:dipeptidyl aminopeptidase/acylaminoacyl peptidase
MTFRPVRLWQYVCFGSLLALPIGPFNTAPSIAADVPHRIGKTTTFIVDGSLAAVSPDGSRLAFVRAGQVCTQSTEGKDSCGPRIPGIDPSSLSWSPDSKQLVFSEAYGESGFEPDIHVLDVASGAETNITQDRIDRIDFDNPKTRKSIDQLPQFSENGKDILFWRTNISAHTATFYSVPASSGGLKVWDPTPNPKGVLISSSGMVGKNVLYSILKIGDSGDGGVFYVSGKSKSTRLVEDKGSGSYLIVRSISQSRQLAVIAYPSFIRRGPARKGAFVLLDLKSGKTKNVEVKDGIVVNATFSPDGKQLLIAAINSTTVKGAIAADGTASSDQSPSIRLMVRDEKDNDTTLIDELPAVKDAMRVQPFLDGRGLGIQWLNENKIVVADTLKQVTMYQLN